MGVLDSLKESVVSKKSVLVGDVRILVSTNVRNFKGFNFFANWDDVERYDYSLYFLEKKCSKKEIAEILPYVDKGYRATRFKEGYYVTDHFGSPVYMCVDKNEYIVIGESLHKVFWPYFIKYILTINSIEKNRIHLKGASFEMNGKAGIFIGRGKSGKSVLLNRVCLNGGKFISNTHNLIEAGIVLGVKSNMRVRENDFFRGIIEKNSLETNIKIGDYNINPANVYEQSQMKMLKNIFIVNHNEQGLFDIHKVDREDAYFAIEQFSFALNVYGLKEDILDYFEGDLEAFGKTVNKMNYNLKNLLNSVNVYYLSIDMCVKENAERFDRFIKRVM